MNQMEILDVNPFINNVEHLSATRLQVPTTKLKKIVRTKFVMIATTNMAITIVKSWQQFLKDKN
jgi:hypothetical protein